MTTNQNAFPLILRKSLLIIVNNLQDLFGGYIIPLVSLIYVLYVLYRRQVLCIKNIVVIKDVTYSIELNRCTNFEKNCFHYPLNPILHGLLNIR